MYPSFADRAELVEHYHRLRWYVPEDSGYKVHIFHSPAMKISREELNADLPPHLDNASGSGENIQLIPWSRRRFLALASRSTSVALWKTASAARMDKVSMLMRRRFVVIDQRARGTWEFARYASFLYDHLGSSERQRLRDQSKERLLVCSVRQAHLKKAYVFGTGPSLARANEFDYADGVRIVCNSIVRNPELLDHIKPHFIAASDFVFHFGPSKYAAEFRRDLIQAMKSTDAMFLVPEQLAPLMFAHFPEIEARTIAVPLTNRYDFRHRHTVNVQLLSRFQVRTLDSVLNLLMLPVASTLADEIFVLGCDGRKPVDKAFWAHHGASQYTGLMQTVNETHPAFFDVDYVDYYDRYCSHVASVIAAGEALGKSYRSLVPSFVPALSEREVGTQTAHQAVGAH